jgi:hypothetical protein
MTAVRWWDYVVLMITVVLTALWRESALLAVSRKVRTGVLGTSVVSALAVGCPICSSI